MVVWAVNICPNLYGNSYIAKGKKHRAKGSKGKDWRVLVSSFIFVLIALATAIPFWMQGFWMQGLEKA
jgi:polyferredoxin